MSSSSETSAPSTAAIALATGILCALGGYLFGQASSLGLFGSDTRKSGAKSSWPNSYDVTIHPDSSDEDLMKSLKGNEAPDAEDDDSEEEDQGELKTFADNKEECKLVLVVRTDLGMTKGWFQRSHTSPLDHRLTRCTLRQNRGPMLSCNPRLLHVLSIPRTKFSHSQTLAIFRSGQGCGAMQERGGATNAAGAGNKPGIVRAHYS